VNFPEEVLEHFGSQIPRQWIHGDESSVAALLEERILRRNRVPDLIAETVHA
jgi:hypothetical protein